MCLGRDKVLQYKYTSSQKEINVHLRKVLIFFQRVKDRRGHTQSDTMAQYPLLKLTNTKKVYMY